MAQKNKSKTSFSNFKNTEIIGQGAFGVVYKGYYDKNNKAFAIKKISKKQLIAQNMIQQMQNEIKIMYSLNHNNIIKIYEVIDEEDYLYLVLELAENGQLYKKLTEKSRFDQQTTKTMIKDIINALQYLHSRNPPIIHRDIKPENILLDKNNKIKLADFGWSNFSNKQKRTTYCGTYDYLAPQMIDKSGHDEKLDIWCLGVLTFQLLTGKPPFSPNPNQVSSGQQIKKLYQNILNVKINFPQDFPVLAKDFVLGILRRNPKERYTLKQLKNHQWLMKNEVSQSILPKMITSSSGVSNQSKEDNTERYKNIISQLTRKNQQLQSELNNLKLNESLIKQSSKTQLQIPIINNGTQEKRKKALQQVKEKYNKQLQKYQNELRQKQKQLAKSKTTIKNLQKFKNDCERFELERNKFQEKYKKSQQECQKLQNKYLQLSNKYQNQKYQYQTKIKQIKNSKSKSSNSNESPDFISELIQSMNQLTKKFNQSKKLLMEASKKQIKYEQMQKELEKLKFQQSSIREQIRQELKEAYEKQLDQVMTNARQQLQKEKDKWIQEKDSILNQKQPNDSNLNKTTADLRQRQLQLQLKNTRELNTYLDRRIKQQDNKIKDLQELLKKKK